MGKFSLPGDKSKVGTSPPPLSFARWLQLLLLKLWVPVVAKKGTRKLEEKKIREDQASFNSCVGKLV